MGVGRVGVDELRIEIGAGRFECGVVCRDRVFVGLGVNCETGFSMEPFKLSAFLFENV